MTDTNTSGADVLAVLFDCMNHALHSRLTAKQVDSLYCARTAVAALIGRNAELEAKTAVKMGVGDGSGQLFVYGDYESIKAAQALVLRCEALAAEVKALRQLHAAVCKNGDWDEGCFYYAGRSASELQQPLRDIEALARASASTGGGNG